jgi:hypothetical protein
VQGAGCGESSEPATDDDHVRHHQLHPTQSNTFHG